jgi:hypothetical protein
MLAAGITAAIALAAPAAAAVTKPTVSTGGVARVTQTSATLTGSVDPNRARTTYYFEVGPQAGRYTTTTGPVGAGSGDKPVAAATDLTGLAPYTTYHYRLVASNREGTRRGRDRAFRTRRQPLGLGLIAAPNPVSYGGAVSLLGRLTGTGNAGRQVKIQIRPFPYTAPWADATSPLVTASDGSFGATVPNIRVNTQFRAVTVGRPAAASPATLVASAVRVSLHATRTHVRRGRRVRFSGLVTPPEVGSLFYLQRRRHGRWVTVKGGVVRHAPGGVSRFGKTIRIRHFGRYRVLVGVNNQNTSGISRTIRIRHSHRRH